MILNLTRLAMTSIAARGRKMRTTITAKSGEAFRQTQIQYRRSEKSLVKMARRAQVTGLMRLFRAQQLSTRAGRYTLAHLHRGAATVFALIVFVLFYLLAHDPSSLKTSEVHLTCAQVVGAALALILSLSIIPAQRAAEAFSPAILKLYAQDRWLVAAFLILAGTTTLSVLLGTNFLPQMDARLSISVQFLLLGFSFDALLLFYNRALDLLIPETAVQLVIRECTKQLTRVSRIVERLIRLQVLADRSNAPTDATRAIYFSASQVSGALRFWIAQLDEIAHKLIARRDTSAANDIVTAMGMIGTQYSEARRNSLILRPDFDNLFAGGVSDISEVLNPIYDCLHVICKEAAKAPNELVVKQGIRTLADMTTHAMTMIHSSNGWHKAPLAFSPCFYLGLCATTAVKANMGDAVLTAVSGFRTILLSQKKDVDTSDLEVQSLESLLKLAQASYIVPDAVWGFPAVKAILLAARHEIESDGYYDRSKTALSYACALAPMEIAMEKAGKRLLQTFPPYDLGFEASVPLLLELVARQVKVDAEQSRRNPFDDFLEAAEDVRHHYRELAQTDFEGTLLRKCVVDSLMAAARVHWTLLVQPPAGTENNVDDVDQSLRSLVSWVPSFFPEQTQPHRFHINEAADSLACLGISLLEHDRIGAARDCASAIAGLAINSAALRPEPFAIANLHQRLEVLARAADALGKTQAAADIRAMIQRPATVADSDWPHFVAARQNRLHDLNRSLQERRNPHRLRDDPISELQRILNRGAA